MFVSGDTIEPFSGELQRLYDLSVTLNEKLVDSYGNRILALKEYTGTGDSLGEGRFYNTYVACKQLTFAFALSDHPKVLSLLDDQDLTCYTFQPEPLIESAVLQGMKILDLGSGYQPTFARSARTFGADVYTVDVIPAEDLKFGNRLQKKTWFEGFTQHERDIEIAKHIQGNLHDEVTLEAISQQAGNDFDLVTAANIKHVPGVEYTARYSEYAVDDLAMDFLKEGGFCFVPDCFGDPITLKRKE